MCGPPSDPHLLSPLHHLSGPVSLTAMQLPFIIGGDFSGILMINRTPGQEGYGTEPGG